MKQRKTVTAAASAENAKGAQGAGKGAFGLEPDAGFVRATRIAAVLVVVCTLAEVVTPTAYGRFGSSAAQISLDPRIGWWLLELPCTVSFCYFFFGDKQRARAPAASVLGAIFVMHYMYRGWIFPALIRVHNGAKSFSPVTAFGGWIVTILHGYLSARWFGRHGPHLREGGGALKALLKPRPLLGLFMYYSGLAMIVWHDSLLRSLRYPGAPRYSIPRGGLFDYATSAQYFVELWAWTGFAILSWGPNGLFILLVSVGNLVPRAARTHDWYLAKFGGEYPASRARLVPFVW